MHYPRMRKCATQEEIQNSPTRAPTGISMHTHAKIPNVTGCCSPKRSTARSISAVLLMVVLLPEHVFMTYTYAIFSAPICVLS
jgi:hypothetical protein